MFYVKAKRYFNKYFHLTLVQMAGLKALCWAWIFIIRIRFPPGKQWQVIFIIILYLAPDVLEISPQAVFVFWSDGSGVC